MYDMLIQNVSIIDGSGAPARPGSVAIVNGKLLVDPVQTAAASILDGAGLALAPGFIDAHSHGDYFAGTDAGQTAKISQGITTELVGQCGMSIFPASTNPERLEMLVDSLGPFMGRVPKEIKDFQTMKQYLQYAEALDWTTNYKQLVGHCALRVNAMGFDNRPPTAAELDYMKGLLREAMEQGAAGLSSGMMYSPSGYANTDEMTELCKVVAEYDGVYTTHMRNEASHILASVEESIEVAERAGVRLNISHHKICGRGNWGLSEQTLALVHKGTDRGLSITLDMYPYTASMTQLNVCLPPAFFAHGPHKMQELLGDPAVRRALSEEMKVIDGRYLHCGGFTGIQIMIAPSTPEAEGLTVQDYAAQIGRDPFDAYFDILQKDGFAAMAIYHSMADADMERIVCDQHTVIGTDGMAQNLTHSTHPRGFGSFPRAIRLFWRERKLMSLEQIIHKMTGMTAQRLLVPNKGLIRNGYDADLVLFDPNTISDRADYRSSLALCTGIHSVIVGGQVAYQNGALTGKFPGRFVPHPR